MKNYNKLLFALVFCVINNIYSKDVMRGAPIPTLKGSEFSQFSRGYDGFVIDKQGQVDPIWVGGAFYALMGDNIYSHKYSDLAWLLWNEIEGLANTFSEGNQRIKLAVERSFDKAFNELIDEPATAKVVKTRPATMPVATTVVSKTLPATRTSRTVAVRPSTPPVQVSARTSFIDKSIMRGMKFTEITNDWLREAMNIALNGAMLTSSNKNTIQQAMIKIAEEAILPSVQTRGLDVNDVRGKIQSIVAQFMMNQGTRF